MRIGGSRILSSRETLSIVGTPDSLIRYIYGGAAQRTPFGLVNGGDKSAEGETYQGPNIYQIPGLWFPRVRYRAWVRVFTRVK